jgi:hypothetical protein
MQFGIRIALYSSDVSLLTKLPALTLMVSAIVSLCAPVFGKTPPAVMWQDPSNIESRDLYYGSGGEKDEPQGSFTFINEDLDGTNPKFVVRDGDGVKWKVKLGEESRPETAASRLLWAVGYFTDEDYFLPAIHVENVPAHLHRGRHFVSADGTMHNVRLKRVIKGEEKLTSWMWRNDPFNGTREFNGLRVMMALMNNWDLKDVNNAVYEYEGKRIYLVSDLGASFGTPGRGLTRKSKGSLKAYAHSRFIHDVTPGYVDFNVPDRPALIHVVEIPAFVRRLHLRWIGKRIPREDARWMGSLLGRLSREQIEAAFRAAGFSQPEIEGFCVAVENRIAELNRL